jgi:hypothetical protein
MTDGGLNLLSRADYIQERDIQYMGDGKRSPILTDIQSGLNFISLFGEVNEWWRRRIFVLVFDHKFGCNRKMSPSCERKIKLNYCQMFKTSRGSRNPALGSTLGVIHHVVDSHGQAISVVLRSLAVLFSVCFIYWTCHVR